MKDEKVTECIIVLLALVGCSNKSSDLEKIVIGGTSLPHADFLKQLKAT